MTDNGTGYRSHLFRQAREALGLRRLRTRPYTPETNGKAERFIKTMLEDWAYAVPCRSSSKRRRQLPVWPHRYNHQRRHGSLAGLPPASRLPARVTAKAGNRRGVVGDYAMAAHFKLRDPVHHAYSPSA